MGSMEESVTTPRGSAAGDVHCVRFWRVGADPLLRPPYAFFSRPGHGRHSRARYSSLHFPTGAKQDKIAE